MMPYVYLVEKPLDDDSDTMSSPSSNPWIPWSSSWSSLSSSPRSSSSLSPWSSPKFIIPVLIDVESHKISDLPPEILQKIFKHFSREEKKVVKSVCKSWSECCNVLSLLHDEALVCCALYQLSDIYELLDKSGREFLNLKFDKVTFDHGSSFWERNGTRVRSIDFIDCQFPNGILEDIIIFCANLFHLSFTYTASFKSIIIDEDLRPPIIDLKKVSKKGIVRENLNSLEIDISNSKWFRLSDYILRKLLRIFPRVKILKITSDFRSDFVEGFDVDPSKVIKENCITMSPVLHYLVASSERIEKVKLDFPRAKFTQSSIRYILETVTSLKRLTELCITANTREVTILEDIDISFCSKQIKSLEFNMSLDYSNLMLLLSKVLLPNSSLQHLKIDQSFWSYPFILTKSLYEKLMSSGLKSFVLTAAYAVAIQDGDSFSSYSSVENTTSVVPSLPTSISLVELPEGILPFLQYYQSLHHLQVDFINSRELQFLLKYQKKLRSLKIKSSLSRGNICIHPKDLTFNELTDIECLELRNPVAAFFFLRTLSPKPILSKLKYLFIDSRTVGKKLFPADLLRAADAMPFLEGLRVVDGYRDRIVSFDNIVELCTKLSRLRYLYYYGDWFHKGGALKNKHYRKVFSICSSLRVLVHISRPDDVDDKTYFFDTLNKKVVLKQDTHRYTLDRPRIGEFTVSWLEF